MSHSRNKQRENNFARNISFVLIGIVVVITLSATYVAPDIAEKNQQDKEWRESATCEELEDYLVENVNDKEYRSYEKIEKIWEIKCK